MMEDTGVDLGRLERFANATRALRDAVGMGPGEVVRLTPLARGEYNANFSFSAGGCGFVLRVALGSQMGLADQVGYEMSALALLRESGRTPRPFYSSGPVDIAPLGFGVEELLPGRPLDYRRDLAEAARVLADIHAVRVADTARLIAPERPLADIVRECEALYARYLAWPGMDQEVARRIDRLFEGARGVVRGWEEAGRTGERHIVNTELNAGNFLMVDGGTSHLVDWEKPLWSEVEQDLGHFLAPTTTLWKSPYRLGAEERGEFVEEYWSRVNGRFPRTGSDGRLAAYLAIICLRGVTWCAMAKAQHETGARTIDRPDVLATIGAYLSPAFLDDIGLAYYGW